MSWASQGSHLPVPLDIAPHMKPSPLWCWAGRQQNAVQNEIWGFFQIIISMLLRAEAGKYHIYQKGDPWFNIPAVNPSDGENPNPTTRRNAGAGSRLRILEDLWGLMFDLCIFLLVVPEEQS